MDTGKGIVGAIHPQFRDSNQKLMGISMLNGIGMAEKEATFYILIRVLVTFCILLHIVLVSKRVLRCETRHAYDRSDGPRYKHRSKKNW